jgi:prepilin-type N-terminal cleavage/methylation domain-containing protein
LIARVRGFTLIETLVAISLLSIAIVAPMSLTSQSLSAAYYARDQITAFNLAQEGLEAVRAIRDGQILEISRSADASSIDLFGPIPVNQDFIIDSRTSDPAQAMHVCPSTGCQPLQTDGLLYGYDPDTVTWTPTNFTRTLRATYVGGSEDEIRLSITVSWPANSGQVRTFSIYDNLYRWVNDGSASTS